MKKLSFSDHGKLALTVFGLGALVIVAMTRHLGREEIVFVIAVATIHGFLIRSIVAK